MGIPRGMSFKDGCNDKHISAQSFTTLLTIYLFSPINVSSDYDELAWFSAKNELVWVR